MVLAFDFEIFVRDDGHNHRGGNEDPVEENGEAIRHQRAVKGRVIRNAVCQQMRLLLPQAEAGKSFAEDQEIQQVLALPGIGENR